MIKRLRKYLMLILMLLFSIIFISILVTINYTNYNFNVEHQIRKFRTSLRHIGTEAFCENPPADPRLEELNYCTILKEKDTDPRILVNKLSSRTDEKLLEDAAQILKFHSWSGHRHALVYVKTYYEKNVVIFFLDNEYALENSRNLLIVSVILGILGLAFLFLFSAFLSRRLTSPVSETLEAQKRFVSDAGHELKTPLTVISSNVDLLESEIGNNPQLQYIRSEANRMAALVNELLTLARLENGSLPDRFQAFSLSNALMGTALPFESLAFEHQITFEINIAENLTYHGNQEQIRQLLSILLDNAFHHTKPGGRVCVFAGQAHRKIVFSVSNTGQPIPEEIQDKIFQRFYRANESRPTSEAHYGLGLSIAQSIAERHHGKISVSCRKGVTTFLVTL